MKAKLHDEPSPDMRSAFHYLIAAFSRAPSFESHFRKER